VKIVTVNARQNAVLGMKRFEDMFALTKALRHRPRAFDGGYLGGVTAPDVIVLQEVRTSNAEIFEHVLRQRYSNARYRIIGPPDAASQILANLDTVSPVGEPVTWSDVCLGESASGGRTSRFYEFVRFTENATGAVFSVAGMHMPKAFPPEAGNDCYERNLDEMLNRLEGEPGAVFIGGDFNKRPVEVQRECDAEETSPALPWYLKMTAPQDGGRVYQDAVRVWHQQHAVTMASEWTHEQKTQTLTCNGATHFRRSRIDYLFSSGAVVADAHADHPGWAGEEPGTRREGAHKYSDHRFVWGRFIISGPPKLLPPTATAAADGVIQLAWQPVEGATGYVVYRAIGDRWFSELARTAADVTTLSDVSTEHGERYRYRIAPVGADTGEGLESRKVEAVADERGPRVVSTTPGGGATHVDKRTNVVVVFDERVKPATITPDRLQLYRGNHLVHGTLTRVDKRVLVFDPTFPLWRGVEYKAVLRPVSDKLGNFGPGHLWRFTTEPPPKKRRRR